MIFQKSQTDRKNQNLTKKNFSQHFEIKNKTEQNLKMIKIFSVLRGLGAAPAWELVSLPGRDGEAQGRQQTQPGQWGASGIWSNMMIEGMLWWEQKVAFVAEFLPDDRNRHSHGSSGH